MVNGNIKKIFLLAAFAVLPGNALNAQIVVISSPSAGGVEMSEVSEWGGYVVNYWRSAGTPPDYAVEVVLPVPGSSQFYSGKASVSDSRVSGWISYTHQGSEFYHSGRDSQQYIA